MATDVDVQYFSHLNGLVLGNNWGDLINLLDTCLVNGIAFPSITSATIDANGDINLTLFAAHNAMLFQIVELSGFSPAGLNGKYRIKGVPSATQLILKANLAGTAITAVGTGKLASLGYEIVYTAQYKRVYRAKNPTAQHPYIRVDETISDGANTYTSTYAKYAMVGLIENMTHIDDYLDPNKLQLPLDTANLAKNWKITGTGTTVVRGWAKWYWATSNNTFRNNGAYQSSAPAAGNRRFTLCGDRNAFYWTSPWGTSSMDYKMIYGCGTYSSSLPTDVICPWFLFANVSTVQAGVQDSVAAGGIPLLFGDNERKFIVPKYAPTVRMSTHLFGIPVLPDNYTGMASAPFNNSNVAALGIPIYDADAMLRGELYHVLYAGKSLSQYTVTSPIVAANSMYVADTTVSYGNNLGGLYFYLGELA